MIDYNQSCILFLFNPIPIGLLLFRVKIKPQKGENF